MKTVVIVFFLVLNVSIVSANEEVFFMKIPPHISVAEAVEAVSQAASGRKWSVEGFKNGVLRIKLNHLDYKAVLDFSFSDDEIYYLDLTTHLNERSPDNGSGRPGWSSREDWEKTSAPKRWIRNLQKDTGSSFEFNKASDNINRSFSHKNMEEKLGSLKKLYDKGLITESEYKLKKMEVLSNY